MKNIKQNLIHFNQARIAGIIFILSLIMPVINWIFIFSKIIDNNYLVTINNVLYNDFIFRICVILHLIQTTALIVLGMLFYRILKAVGKKLAFFAFLLKLVESLLLILIAFFHFIILLILKDMHYLIVIDQDKLKSILGFFINKYMLLGSFFGIFHTLSYLIFFYLFLKSKFIPGILSVFGIITYTIGIIWALSNILIPDYAGLKLFHIIAFTPSILCELIIGFWLLIRGIKMRPLNNSVAHL